MNEPLPKAEVGSPSNETDGEGDLVELGTASTETRGGFTGFMYDGGAGRWSF
jgi:hypothetical protein